MIGFLKAGNARESGLEIVLNQLEALSISSGLHTKKEKRLLWDLAKCKGAGAIVEIGSFEGYSTIILAKSLNGFGCVYAIDPHTGKLCDSDEIKSSLRCDTWTRFNQNIQDTEVFSMVRPIKLKSEEAVVGWDNPLKLLWIDGSHRYEDVKKDFLLWYPYLLLGGVVVFHDCWIAGVRRVIVNHLLRNRLFGEFEFTPCCMFRATYLGKEHGLYLQRSFWRLVFWLRGAIEEKYALRKWLLHLLRWLS
ncbi:hypothetical protein ES706_01373 [subsurface metagenome]|nr:hypothetical protein [Dehalococcoidia bacterium]